MRGFTNRGSKLVGPEERDEGDQMDKEVLRQGVVDIPHCSHFASDLELRIQESQSQILDIWPNWKSTRLSEEVAYPGPKPGLDLAPEQKYTSQRKRRVDGGWRFE